MRRVVVINAKGGCGKTTIATNLASYYAVKGYGTALFDYDPQGSSIYWTRTRPSTRVRVLPIQAFQAQSSITRTFALRVPPEINRIVVDTPAGLKGIRLADHLKDGDTVIIPVLPSSIDIHASAEFIRDLLLLVKARSRRMRIAIVANRVRMETPAMRALEAFLENLKIPVLARLRDDVHYLTAAEQGLGAHELPAADDAEENPECKLWEAVFSWIEADPAAKVPLTALNG